MGNRHINALGIIDPGACNPSGIAHSIVEACREMRASPFHQGTAQITSDPAIRLMAYQLAYICGVAGIMDEDEYARLVTSCRRLGGVDRKPMVKTTKAQRKALKVLWERRGTGTYTYRQLREKVVPMVMGDGAIVVPWAGMYVAIETDGYAHS